MTSDSAATTTRIQLWDLPLRLFHWGLVASVSVALLTGKLGGSWMALHGKAGLAIVGLLVFRLVWGFWGSQTARFFYFVPRPSQIIAYLRGHWQGLGHNPLGALSVLALLSFLLIQAALGLFGNDDIAFTGPLAALVQDDLALTLTGLHRRLAYGLYGLLALHLAAIFFYVVVRKAPIVRPMVTGHHTAPAGTQEPRRAGRFALVIALLLAAASVWAASGAWIPAPQASAPSSPVPAKPPAW